MKRLHILTFILLFSLLQMFSQVKRIVYVDEGYRQINFIEYSKKLNSNIFQTTIVENDTVFFKKLRFKEYYGHLNRLKKRQINNFFSKRYRIDTSKIWLIHYIESLPVIDKKKNESGIIFMDSLNHFVGKILIPKNTKFQSYNYYFLKIPFYHDSVHKSKKTIVITPDLLNHEQTRLLNKKEVFHFLDNIDITLHKHIISFEDYKNSILKEKKKYDKFDNVLLLHFYTSDPGNLIEDTTLHFYKDQHLIVKNIFSDGLDFYQYIVIYPNGDIYMRPNSKFPANFFKSGRYMKYRKKWERKYKRYR